MFAIGIAFTYCSEIICHRWKDCSADFFLKKVRRTKANRAWVDFIVCQLLLKEANGQSWPWWILIIRWKVLIKQISWDCRLPARAHQTPKSRDWFERTTQDQDQPLPMNQISPKFSTQPVVSMHIKNWTIKTPGEVWKCFVSFSAHKNNILFPWSLLSSTSQFYYNLSFRYSIRICQ